MKYSVMTFGCRVNQADSLGVEEDFLARGAVPARLEDADLVVVNTCSVTASADQAARQAIRRVSRMNPRAKIVVTGCYATRRPDEVCDLPNVVRVVPNDEKPRLIAILRSALLLAEPDDKRVPPASDASDGGSLGGSGGQGDPRRVPLQPDLTSADRFGDGDGSCGAVIEPGVAGRTAFTLRVQTGCAEPCAYCIIPSTRGTPRSRPVQAVIHDLRRVSAAGFKEVAITGVHLGSYGRDLVPTSSLTALLEALDRTARAESSLLFRVSSLEPMDCTADIVSLMAESASFAAHFHLPLQHASDRVLRAMRRPYTIAAYAALVDGIRARLPQASIGSDLIVGFPGEDESDFQALTSYLEQSPLTHLHVFPYSDRPGTAASLMAGKVPGATIRERSRQLREISERLARQFRESQVGTVHRALTIDDGTLAVTGNYLKLKVPAGSARNEWVDVRVRRDGEGLRGELVS